MLSEIAAALAHTNETSALVCDLSKGRAKTGFGRLRMSRALSIGRRLISSQSPETISTGQRPRSRTTELSKSREQQISKVIYFSSNSQKATVVVTVLTDVDHCQRPSVDDIK